MKTAILTGFQVFGDYAVNPTEILANALHGKTLSGHHIHSMVFSPVILAPDKVEDYGQKIVETVIATGGSVIVSLGMSSEARGLRVETECVNWVENDKYCTQFENRKPLYSDYPPKERKRVALEGWNFSRLSGDLLSVGISFEMSANPGSYCCNALMFRAVRALEQSSAKLPFLFAHVPCTEESIRTIPDFDRVKKTLIQQEDLRVIVEKVLESYGGYR